MGKIALQSLLAILFLITSSCMSVAVTTQPAAPAANQAAQTVTATPLPTRRPTTTATPTPSLTPDPTFDPASMVTSTPFPPAVCPEEDPGYEVPDLPVAVAESYSYSAEELVLRLLSEGASFKQVQQVDDLLDPYDVVRFTEVDLTGDSVNEIVIHRTGLVIIGCVDNLWEILLIPECNCTGSSLRINSAQDLNLNGVPEVVLEESAGVGRWTIVYVYEWNGRNFAPLLLYDLGETSHFTSALARSRYWYEKRLDASMNGPAEVTITDLDGNGSKEILLDDNGQSHVPDIICCGPWRGKEVTYQWDGLHFIYSSLEMDPPEFRFQAVQDADRYFLMGDYEKALGFYREAIFSDQLEWWSLERMNYIRNSFYAEIAEQPTPLPPFPDPNESSALAAYSRYRIMLYWLTSGSVSDAQIVYDTLLEENPEGTAGYPYAQMASILWNSYQETGDLVAACQPVVTFVEEHEEILDPLEGSGTSMQSHIYEPFDVCPFTWLSQIPNP